MQKQKADQPEPNFERNHLLKENSYKKRLQQDSARRRLKTKAERNEAAIAAAEAVINELNKQLCNDEVSTNYTEIMKLTEQLEQENTKLEQLMEEWEQIQSKIMQI
ncbi:MAG: ABC transporter C-terminal domain-containing protein [Oscillospiraceae bacterium]|nr:ABC transporter C-terminal domain-containing protein [Oscillospiraceae bacterium]MDD4413315.1 ABC transporter C-terminal domain-containing protein [Oscillospiraceae bacterium]